MILGATVQKLWMFEVFGQGLARAGMCWSQPVRVDHLHKKWKAGEKKKFKKKRADWPCPGVDPRLAGDRWSPASRGSTPRDGQSVQIFLFLKTFFEACPYTLKCKILHFPWKLEFSPFSKKINPKFRVHLDLHIYRWDFWFMKN
jgi:hypothetical protein